MEHAAHAGHGGHGPADRTGTYIGLSMAVLGVLLAFCSAMVGAARTELIKTMVEKSEAHAKYQAQTTKHRLVIVQLRAVHSSIPSMHELETIDAEIAKLVSASKPAADAKPGDKAATDGGAALVLEGLRLTTKHIVSVLAPEPEDALKLVHLSKKYEAEREAAKEWTESFEELIHAHTEAAEHYEWAQLAAEIGIVVASIALLLANRKAWYLALVLGASSMGIIGWTFADTHPHVTHGEHESETKGHAYAELRKGQSASSEDEELMKSVEQAFEKHEGPGAPHGVPPAPHAAPPSPH